MCECSASRSASSRIRLDEVEQIALPPRRPVLALAPPPLPAILDADVVQDPETQIPRIDPIRQVCRAYLEHVQAAQSIAQVNALEQRFDAYDQKLRRLCCIDQDSYEAETFYRELPFDADYNAVLVAFSARRIALSIQQAGALAFEPGDALPAPNMAGIAFRMVNPDQQILRPFVTWVLSGTPPAFMNCQEGVAYAMVSAGLTSRERLREVLGIGEETQRVEWDDSAFATQWTPLESLAQPLPRGAVVVFGESSSGHIALHLGGGQFFSIWGAHPDTTVVTLAQLLPHTAEMMGRSKFGTGGTLCA